MSKSVHMLSLRSEFYLKNIDYCRRFFAHGPCKTRITLPCGQKMPSVGLGTWETAKKDEVETAIKVALETGYRHIDTAFIYENETAIGKTLQRWFSSGKIKRKDLFITTKLPMIGVHQDRVDCFMKTSLDALKLDYVDLYLVHFPVCFKYDKTTMKNLYDEKGNLETEEETDQAALWRKMEEQVKQRRAKNIGLSNYNISQISTVLETATIKPATLQVELHVYLQQKELVAFCQENGISVFAYSPLGSPGINTFFKRMGTKPKRQPNILDDPLIKKLAQKHSKTPAQIALRFNIQRGVGVLPKSVTACRIRQNINIFDFTLSGDEMQELYGLDMGEEGRIVDFRVYKGLEKHPDFPFGQCS